MSRHFGDVVKLFDQRQRHRLVKKAIGRAAFEEKLVQRGLINLAHLKIPLLLTSIIHLVAHDAQTLQLVAHAQVFRVDSVGVKRLF